MVNYKITIHEITECITPNRYDNIKTIVTIGRIVEFSSV